MSDATKPMVSAHAAKRRHFRAAIAASGLPPMARALIERVVNRTRLWRNEKADVADELIAHFADGLAAGETANDLIASFGDERRAAALIRRGKVRNRSMLWKIRRAVGRLIVAFVAVYVAIGVYFMLGRPSPSVDYLAIINKTAVETPVDDRAWPIYRQALLQMKSAKHDGEAAARGPEIPEVAFVDPRSKRWPEAAAWLTNHAAAIELLRQASAKPQLGFVAGWQSAPEDWPLSSTMPAAEIAKFQAELVQRKRSDPLAGSLIAVILPHLNEMRPAANVLAADCELARRQGDAPRTYRNLVALLDMADQLSHSHPVLVTYMVAIGINAMALNEVERTLVQTPDLLDDAAMTRLAHRISGPTVAADLISFEGERMLFHDVVQRMYTDDGHGDGRLTPQGIEFFRRVQAMYSNVMLFRVDDGVSPLDIAGGPLAMTLAASRREVLEAYDEMMDAREAALHRPLREVDVDAVDRRLSEMRASTIGSIRYAIVGTIASALSRPQVTAERLLGRRDGVMAALALELHRRRAGKYPATLDELVPTLLPAVPTDRVTGGPIRYRLDADGTPLLYSLGADRDDDGGRPVTARGEANVSAAAEWHKSMPQPDGDWMLYPTLRFDPPPQEDPGAP